MQYPYLSNQTHLDTTRIYDSILKRYKMITRQDPLPDDFIVSDSEEERVREYRLLEETPHQLEASIESKSSIRSKLIVEPTVSNSLEERTASLPGTLSRMTESKSQQSTAPRYSRILHQIVRRIENHTTVAAWASLTIQPTANDKAGAVRPPVSAYQHKYFKYVCLG